jgi:hypothetical protein
VWRPSAIADTATATIKELRHGLSLHAPTESFKDDQLRFHRGNIFPLLYEKRVGTPLQRESIDLLKLLSHVPEVATDLDDVQLPPSNIGYIRHAVTSQTSGVPMDTTFHLRSICAIRPGQGNIPDAVTAAYLKRHYSPVSPNQVDGRRLFGFNGWETIMSFYMESLESRPLTSDTIYVNEAVEFIQRCFNHIAPMLDVSTQTGEYSIFAPSIETDELLLFPSSLASYAAMFYVSSIVRYRPYRLHSGTSGLLRWLLNAYVEQAPIRLLLAALNGISGQQHLFDAS